MRLSDHLVTSKELMNLVTNSRDEVFRKMVEMVPDLAGDEAGQDTLFKALIEREQLHSTGIGDGIALPHSRNALVGLVSHPAVIFARHVAGLQFNAIDGQPAHLIFLLAAPNVTIHLGLLARINRMLRDPKLRRTLMTAATPALAIELLWNAEGE
jgi:mannitol/fructose-specific phosphotransferase system IIA component (Ntr-type)